MPGPRAYDFMYRVGLARAVWSGVDRWEIRELVEGGPCDPTRLAPASGGPPRAIDPGSEQTWEIERIPHRGAGFIATFLLTRT